MRALNSYFLNTLFSIIFVAQPLSCEILIAEMSIPACNEYTSTAHKNPDRSFALQDTVEVDNIIFLVVAPAAAPVASAAVVTAVEVATTITLATGCIYSFLKDILQKNNSQSHIKNSGGNPCPCGHACQAGCNCGCFCGCGKTVRNQNKNQKKHNDNQNRKANKMSKSEFEDRISDRYEHLHSNIYQLKKGAVPIAKAEHLQWDHFHGEVEAYTHKGKIHLGSIDPLTELIYKPAEPGRTIKI